MTALDSVFCMANISNQNMKSNVEKKVIFWEKKPVSHSTLQKKRGINITFTVIFLHKSLAKDLFVRDLILN